MPMWKLQRIILVTLILGIVVMVGTSIVSQAQLTLEYGNLKHDRVTLDWSKPTTIAEADFGKYEIARYKGCGGTLILDKTYTINEFSTTAMEDSGLSSETDYSYEVGAFRSGMAFPDEQSPLICVKTPERPIDWGMVGWGFIAIGVVMFVFSILSVFLMGRPLMIPIIIGVVFILIGWVILQVS